MKQQIQNLAPLLTIKKIYFGLLFVYFGFMAIPQWFRLFSPQFLIWLLALPIIVLTLVVTGLWGIIGIWRTKAKKEQPFQKHIFFAQISCTGLLWFVVSLALAYGTHFLYNHQKFNSEIWQNPNSARYVSYDLTPRQRMLEDVVKNVLPGSNQSKIESLLGKSTKTGYFSSSERDLIYMLGAERGLGVDSEWLLIWFDNSGNFERYDIVTD